ncbi:hypothetical protein [Fodinicola acaciae]|uniref:hypothetical protein n=1 Tax=Fodinicola acaciae TaxID=2681555 RepID=UPI0013D187F3|nr:hypothetical protein [Fodinicola acaciae]
MRTLLTAGVGIGAGLVASAVARLSGALPAGFVGYVSSSYQAVIAGLSTNPIGQFVVDNAPTMGPVVTASAIAGWVSYRAAGRKAKREALETDAKATEERDALVRDGIDPDEHPLRAAKRLADEVAAQRTQRGPDAADVERRHQELIAELQRQHGETLTAMQRQYGAVYQQQQAEMAAMQQQTMGMQQQHAADLAGLRQELFDLRQRTDTGPRRQQSAGSQLPPEFPVKPGLFRRVVRPGSMREYEAKQVAWTRWEADRARQQQAQQQPAQAVPMPPQDTGQAAPSWGPAQGPANYPSGPRGGAAPEHHPGVRQQNQQAMQYQQSRHARRPQQ